MSKTATKKKDTDKQETQETEPTRLNEARDRLKQAATDVQDRYQQVSKEMRRGAERAAETIKRTAETTAHRAKEGYDSAAQGLREGYAKVRKDLSKRSHDVNDFVKENPGKALLTAAGIGFVLGLIFTRRRES